MSSAPFEVLEYKIEALIELMEAAAGEEHSSIHSKTHVLYFQDYFDHDDIAAKTIIVERQYTDKDYTEDYAEYYSRCFKNYQKDCIRLHFFKKYHGDDKVGRGITAQEFRTLLRGKNPAGRKRLQAGYLGFVILKPLPCTVVGRTCLKVYGPDDGRRQYRGIKTFAVDLFGIPLKVDSLPYQEQDREVAACATSALWSAFHGSGLVFHHHIPTPSEVTKAASNHSLRDSRYFPNSGLTAHELATAVRSVGLEPLKIGVPDAYTFRAVIYAYLSFGLPLVLGFELKKIGTDEFVGRHAVAITGYSLPKANPPRPGGMDKLFLRVSGLNEIYVHDDQVGPFARMKIEGTGEKYRLTTSYGLSIGTTQPRCYAKPSFVMAPVYHKIRIPFEVAHEEIAKLDATFGYYFGGTRLCWNIRLMTNNGFKEALAKRRDPRLSPKDRETIMTTSLPRYVWAATAYRNEVIVADFLLDATDLLQGVLLALPVHYEQDIPEMIKALMTDKPAVEYCRAILGYYIRK